jgi:hypothetical protein
LAIERLDSLEVAALVRLRDVEQQELRAQTKVALLGGELRPKLGQLRIVGVASSAIDRTTSRSCLASASLFVAAKRALSFCMCGHSRLIACLRG